MDTRAGAYAVIVEDHRILLSRWVPRIAALQPAWTLPGGGMELGEQPAQTALREVREETGHTVQLEDLLGVSSFYIAPELRQTAAQGHLHALRVIYRGRVTGGTLTPELNGSSDDARWIPLTELKDLPVLDLVRVGLDLAGHNTERLGLTPEELRQAPAQSGSDSVHCAAATEQGSTA